MWQVVRLGIVGLWILLVGMLVWRRADTAPESITVPRHIQSGATEEWMGLYRGGEKIGYARVACGPEGDGFHCEESSLLKVAVMETPQTVRTSIKARTDARFSLRTVDFELTNGAAVFRVSGQVDGDRLRLRTSVGAEESSLDIRLSGPVYLPSNIWRSVARERLDDGKRYEVAVFDPALAKEHAIAIKAIGDEVVPGSSPPVRGRRFEEEFAGVTATVWIDADGRVLREEGPLGLAMVRETASQAVESNWGEGVALDLVASVSIPVRPPLPEPRALARLQLRLGGIALDRVPTDDRQRLERDVMTVTRETVPAATTYAAPYDEAELLNDVRPTPLLQSDHPRIRAAAELVVGGERRPVEIVRRLSSFVFERLDKVPTISVPNALQVLDMGAGDCNEHAVLLAALARAVGVPARVAAGIVYVDGAFAYHAWNEVWLDRWVSVDPTFGQFPADATHVKFVSGGPEDHLAMMGIIGRLTIEVAALPTS